jgi:outer membrane protein assembly factor BamB
LPGTSFTSTSNQRSRATPGNCIRRCTNQAANATSDAKTIYVGSADDYLRAISHSGKVRWRFRTGGIIDAAGVLGDDGTLTFGSGDETLYCLKDGKEKWKFKVPGGPVMGTPAMGLSRSLVSTSITVVNTPVPNVFCNCSKILRCVRLRRSNKVTRMR